MATDGAWDSETAEHHSSHYTTEALDLLIDWSMPSSLTTGPVILFPLRLITPMSDNEEC